MSAKRPKDKRTSSGAKAVRTSSGASAAGAADAATAARGATPPSELTARQRRKLGLQRPRGRPLKPDARLLQVKAAVTSDEKVAVLALATAMGHVTPEGEPLEGALVRALVVKPALEHQAKTAANETEQPQ